ncbi:ribonuclease catalytic domain-containing protein [Thermosulfuriphilus sp.]
MSNLPTDPVGRIVEYLDQNRFFTALVIGLKDRRLRLINHLGREVLLPRSRLLHLSREVIKNLSRSDVIVHLARRHQRREELSRDIDLPMLWELVSGEMDEASVEELAEIYFGQGPEDDQVAALIRAILEDKIYFRFRDGRIIINPAEVVSQIIERREAEARRIRLLQQGSLYLQALWQGREEEIPVEIRDFVIETLKDYCLRGDEAKEAALAKDLLKRADLSRPGAAFELLVKAGVFEIHENLELLRHEVRPEFPPQVASEAQRLAQAPQVGNREDLRQLELFTIDGEETTDYDDALHLRELPGGQLEIGVHIADVAAYVPPGSLVFEEALDRAQTIYLPDLKIPMLPTVLSEEALSLKAGQDKLAVSFIMVLALTGDLISYRIVPSWVRIRENLVYDQVDQILEDSIWERLYQLAKVLRERRIEAGALPLPIPEVVIRLKDGEIVLERLEITGSRFLVAEMMILANSVAARFLKETGTPALFRSQPPPRERLIHGAEMDLLKNFIQRRAISRGSLSTVAEPHHGLGLAVYTTVTSPIRRMVDLIVQHQLKGALAGEVPFGEEDLSRMAQRLEAATAVVNTIKHRRHRYWLLRYLEAHRRRPFAGLVVDSSQRRAQVLLLEPMLLVDVPLGPGQGLEVGQEVEVAIVRVNAREDIIKATLANQPGRS